MRYVNLCQSFHGSDMTSTIPSELLSSNPKVFCSYTIEQTLDTCRGGLQQPGPVHNHVLMYQIGGGGDLKCSFNVRY